MPVPPSPASRRPVPRDQGAALVLTLFATTLAMIVGTTILSVTVGNLRSARLSQDAAAALDAADAGLAQASSHLRTHGVAGISCSPGCPNGYGSEASPTVVDLPGGSQYRVWVEALAPLPTHNPGRYVVHSTGRSGDGVREIEAEVSIGTRPLGLPLALFARSFDGGGNGAVFQESILTTGCVWSRGHITVSGTDVAYDIPAAVHSSQYVSTSNGGNSNCGPSSGAIHKNGACHTSYPHDQSVQGGAYPAGQCKTLTDPYPAYYGDRDLNGDGSTDVQGSRIKDETSLRKLFSIPEQAFTDAQLDQLRAVAKSQYNYWKSNAYTTPTPGEHPHAVLFFDLPAGGNTGQRVDLNMSGWSRPFDAAVGSPECKDQSLLIVVVGGDVKLNAGTRLVANIVLTSPAPYGRMNKLNGNAELIGTVYADSMDLTGTGDVKLDECFVHNLSPSLVDTTLTVTDYREVDRTDRP